jgi:hypothetical protein
MTPGRTPWSFRVTASGDRGPNHSESRKLGFARYKSRNLIFPSRGSWACGPPPEMKVSARARPRCCGGTPPSQGGSTGSIPVGRSTAQHNASPSVVLVSERLDFQGRGSRVRSPSPAPTPIYQLITPGTGPGSIGKTVDHLLSEQGISSSLASTPATIHLALRVSDCNAAESPAVETSCPRMGCSCALADETSVTSPFTPATDKSNNAPNETIPKKGGRK